MKFSQLEIGQRFFYQGEAYIKDGPLSASGVNSGHKRGMRRADPVQPADAGVLPQPPESAVEHVDRSRALECLQGLHDAACLALQASGLTDQQQQQVQQKLEFALQMYRQRLTAAEP
jgi:hypothetical protein